MQKDNYPYARPFSEVSKVLKWYGYKYVTKDEDAELMSYVFSKHNDEYDGEYAIVVLEDGSQDNVIEVFIASEVYYNNESDYGNSGVKLIGWESNYPNERYKLNLLEKVLEYIKNPILHELEITKAHAKNIAWVYENLWPVLEWADYKLESSVILGNVNLEEGELCIYFEHPKGRSGICVSTDNLTGNLRLNEDLSDLAWKTQWEILEILRETEWKDKDEFAYLYENNKTSEIFD